MYILLVNVLLFVYDVDDIDVFIGIEFVRRVEGAFFFRVFGVFDVVVIFGVEYFIFKCMYIGFEFGLKCDDEMGVIVDVLFEVARGFFGRVKSYVDESFAFVVIDF